MGRRITAGRKCPARCCGSTLVKLVSRDAAGAITGPVEAARTLLPCGDQRCDHDQALVAGVKRVKVHKRLPVRKREREGLSAGGAYNSRTADVLPVDPERP